MNEEERMKKNEYNRKYRQTEKYKKYHKEYWAKHGAEINAKRRNRKAYKYRNEKATEYIKDYFYIDKETGEYYLTHTFNSSNLYELLKILEGDKE